MKKEKRLKHANHNEEVCNLINKTGKFPDWVITTAFYSAIHFVSYHIFPKKEIDDKGKEIEFLNLDYYYSYHNLGKDRISKHAALSDLVFEYFPKISPDYDWLFDLCHKARYQNYQQTERDAERSLKLLGIIKAACNIPISATPV